MTEPIDAATAGALVRVLERECDRVVISGGQWLDTRPMTSPHECGPRMLDINRQLLDSACAHGLITRHPAPELAHLVCVMFTGA